jgi:PAS domain S-box-containing protein
MVASIAGFDPILAGVLGLAAGALLTAGVAASRIGRKRRTEAAPAPSTPGIASEIAGNAPGQSRDELRRLLGRANILLWWADVRREGGRYVWYFDVPKVSLESPIARLATAQSGGGLWESERLLDQPEMRIRNEAAFASGAPGYRQEFRVLFEGSEHWLRESVSIQRTAEDSWSLFGAVTDITPEHEADQALKRGQEQMKAILEREDCMVWQARVVETDGVFEWHFTVPNSGLQRKIFGSKSEFLFEGTSGPNAKKLFGHYTVPEQPETDSRFQAAVREGISGYDQEFHLVSPEKTFLVQERVSITQVKRGEWNTVGLVVDITARHEAEEARKASQAQLVDLLDKVDCILWQAHVTKDSEGGTGWRFVSIPPSRLYRKIFGKDPVPDQNFLWLDTQPQEIEQMNRRAAGALFGGAGGYEQEFRVKSDGKELWLREQVSIVPIQPGEWNVVGIATDVSARRTAETALATEKERLAVTLRAMDEGVITVDINAAVQFMNLTAEKLTGCRQNSGIGRQIDGIFSVAEASAGQAEFALPIHRALREGLVVDIPAGIELKGSKSRRYFVEGCCAPVRNERSEIIGAVLVFRDITERQRLKAEVQRASKLESIGILAGGIAHDFNNLLTAIMGNLTLAALDLDQGRSVKEYLDGAQAASLRARDLTQQLLTFAKGGDPVRSAIQLSGIVEEVAQFALRGSRTKCEFALEENLWPANADKGQIGQIVQNLVINAAQAMPTGGIIRISAVNETVPAGTLLPLAPGDYVHIGVTDMGQGIEAENLANIFDPYFTTKKQGSGLGLATVYSIVKKHKGHISVDSEINKGTTFQIWLPALHVRVEEPPENRARSVQSFTGRVLLMDDEEAIRKMAGQLLRRMGLEVEMACDGAEAVEKFKAAHAAGKDFAAVVMDLTVPGGMGGCEALVEMRRIAPEVRAIVSSGYSSDAVMANYQAYGFRGMVAKPYAIDDFVKVLQEVLPPSPSHELVV